MLPYVLIAGACGLAISFLLVVGLCEAARKGDEQPEPEPEQIQWPEFAIERREATEDELEAFSGAAVEAYRSKVAQTAAMN